MKKSKKIVLSLVIFLETKLKRLRRKLEGIPQEEKIHLMDSKKSFVTIPVEGGKFLAFTADMKTIPAIAETRLKATEKLIINVNEISECNEVKAFNQKKIKKLLALLNNEYLTNKVLSKIIV